MKELHFYIQSLMILVALACGLQGPDQGVGYFYAGLLMFLLGVYQYGMSWMLITRLKRNKGLLTIYWVGVKGYLILLILLGLSLDLSDFQWQVLVFGVPWIFAIYFLVVIEDLLWKRVSPISN